MNWVLGSLEAVFVLLSGFAQFGGTSQPQSLTLR